MKTLTAYIVALFVQLITTMIFIDILGINDNIEKLLIYIVGIIAMTGIGIIMAIEDLIMVMKNGKRKI